MDRGDTLFLDTAERVFARDLGPGERRDADGGAWLGRLWDAAEAAGLSSALLPEAAGGFGADVPDALALLRTAGFHAAPLPLAETMLAGWILAAAALPVPSGPLTLAPVRPDEDLVLERDGAGWHLSGIASRVPWSRNASAIAILAGTVLNGTRTTGVACVPAGGWVSEPDINLAGEPRDTLIFDVVLPEDAVQPLPEGLGRQEVRALGAATRTLLVAGAIARILEMTTRYAGERVQFGRAIGKFQAVQQNLAVLAGQAVAADAACRIAVDAFAPGGLGSGPNVLAIAAAKVRAGEAASVAAAIAHQVHGALGFTQEHPLHHWTKRLWSWRDEFGHEAEWSLLVGRHMAKAGADRFWAEITAAA